MRFDEGGQGLRVRVRVRVRVGPASVFTDRPHRGVQDTGGGGYMGGDRQDTWRAQD